METYQTTIIDFCECDGEEIVALLEQKGARIEWCHNHWFGYAQFPQPLDMRFSPSTSFEDEWWAIKLPDGTEVHCTQEGSEPPSARIATNDFLFNN